MTSSHLESAFWHFLNTSASILHSFMQGEDKERSESHLQLLLWHAALNRCPERLVISLQVDLSMLNKLKENMSSGIYMCSLTWFTCPSDSKEKHEFLKLDTPLPGGRLRAEFSKNYQVQNCSPTPAVLPEQRHTQRVCILEEMKQILTGV